jgi:Calcineurin-like phosphoesterase
MVTGDAGSGSDEGGGSGASDSGSGSDSATGSDAHVGTDSGGGPCTTDTGPITGTVGASGGSVSRLVFAVVGDTRPANEDDVGGYPTTIITKIFQDIQAASPQPVLVLGTGDYQFSSTGHDATGPQQVGIYMTTRQSYTGPFFPAMGNHECGVSGGFSTSDNNNCGPGNQGGVTPNYTGFMSQMLGPISQTNPYYSVNVNASDGSWTAKFVMTAANSWDTAQQTWLQTTMAQKTTYTFVVRHEPSDAYPPLPPGVAGVDAVLAMYPYTLLITGHTHTYGHYSDAPQTVVIGNGGAPLSSKDYGYGLFSQRCDGAIVGDEVDYESGATDSEFHFVITPGGTITS